MASAVARARLATQGTARASAVTVSCPPALTARAFPASSAKTARRASAAGPAHQVQSQLQVGIQIQGI